MQAKAEITHIQEMASSTFFVSQQDFNLFHRIDRELYTLLVLNLWRDPIESVQVLALWLWLERVGYRKVVQKTLALPQILINELADEAVSCLNVINQNGEASSSSSSNSNTDNPLMQCLMEKDLTLQFFNKHRRTAVKGVPKIINQVCMKAFCDIIQHAVERNAARTIADQAQQVMPQTLLQPNMVQVQNAGLGSMVRSGDVNVGIIPSNMVHPDDRTMFVTFSKGYPVFEWEVREFFNRAYGDCIESLHMQEVMPYDQSLFARIIFHSPNTIDMVLNGTGKAKFTINGKHVWARKFVSKRPRDPPPPPPSAPTPPVNFPLQFGSFQNFPNVGGVVLGQPAAGGAVQAPFFQF